MKYFNMINENSYYGKNSILIKLESHFEDLINIYKKRQFAKAYPCIEKIEYLLESLFNFKTVYIETHMVAGIEAYTYPVYVSQFKDAFDNSPFSVVKGKYGPQMASKKNAPSIHVVFSVSVINDMNLTAEELLGIMLHEIGHSFDRRPTKILGNIIIFETLKVADKYAKVSNKKDKNIVELRNKYKKDKEFHKELINQYKQTKKDKKEQEKNYEDFQTSTFNQMFGSVLMTLFSPFIFVLSATEAIPYVNKMDAEKFSDSFATAFGYGDALGTGLIKLEKFAHTPTHNAESRMTPFTRFWYVYNIALMEIIGGNLTTHPETFKRLQYISEYLQVCINEEDNPRIREEMIKSKVQIDEAYERFINNDLTIKSSVKKSFSDMFQLVFKRPDISDLFSSFRDNNYTGLDLED